VVCIAASSLELGAIGNAAPMNTDVVFRTHQEVGFRALWPATTEAETVRFNLINPKTNNRIRMQILDAGTGRRSPAATW